MSSTPPAKIGRGGAGNFWSKRDLEDAVKSTTTEDLDAQCTRTTTTATLTRTTTTAQQQGYARSGRGGAGNVVPAAAAAAAAEEIEEEAAVAPSTGRVAYVLTHVGRGGAGNWTADVEGEDGEEGRRAVVDERVRGEVERGLRVPERAYKAPGAGAGEDWGE